MESLVTIGRVNPRKTREDSRYFNSYGLFENSKQKSGCLRRLINPRGFSEFATYPSTNDYPFDFAQSLLLLHKREGGKCRFTVGEALVASGLVFVCLASQGRTELVGSDNIDGLFFAILCCRLFLILSSWPNLSVLLRGRRRGGQGGCFCFELMLFLENS